MDAVDVGMLVLRLWLGFVILVHGLKHARSLEGTAGWFASKGFRRADLQARASAAGEIAIGAGLVLGLLTSFVAAGLVATMIVAFWSIHRFAGFFVFSRPDEGYEYVATLGVGALVSAVVGPGQASLDHAIGLADVLDGWWGFVIVLGGVAAAAAQLATFWRLPAPEEEATPDPAGETGTPEAETPQATEQGATP
jgi:putative oxidoreductase